MNRHSSARRWRHNLADREAPEIYIGFTGIILFGMALVWLQQ